MQKAKKPDSIKLRKDIADLKHYLKETHHAAVKLVAHMLHTMSHSDSHHNKAKHHVIRFAKHVDGLAKTHRRL